MEDYSEFELSQDELDELEYRPYTVAPLDVSFSHPDDDILY